MRGRILPGSNARRHHLPVCMHVLTHQLLQVVPRTREGEIYQAYVKPPEGRRPRLTEQEEKRAGVPVSGTFFMSSVAREKQDSDALAFDAVGDAEHHRADGAH